jgi:hypothetical protein
VGCPQFFFELVGLSGRIGVSHYKAILHITKLQMDEFDLVPDTYDDYVHCAVILMQRLISSDSPEKIINDAIYWQLWIATHEDELCVSSTHPGSAILDLHPRIPELLSLAIQMGPSWNHPPASIAYDFFMEHLNLSTAG